MQNSIILQNLKCGGCAKTITSKISEIAHIQNVSVDVAISTIFFNAENEESTVKVKEKLKSIGYPFIYY
jgi:copper chaperone CopZ